MSRLEKWKVNGEEKYFQKTSETKWKETDKGKIFATFDFVEQINDKVVIFAADRNFYLTIDSTSVKWGPTRENANLNHLCDGKWLNLSIYYPIHFVFKKFSKIYLLN
jgi:hypothetical protein